MKLMVFALTLCLSATAWSNVKVGSPAPKFNEKGQNGQVYNLDNLKGSWVVLEWYNEGCPYVKKHYKSSNMQKLQKKFTAKGVKWLTVATSASGKQGYVDPKTATAHFKSTGMNSTALLLDADGTMGKAYGAKTTPHMFIINPEGVVVYAGAIDSDDSANPDTIKEATNYVNAALKAGLAGKPIKTSSTKPYGCSVKYQ